MRTVRFLTNSPFTGANAWFPLARDRGYFREEGIEVEFIDGSGAFSAAGRVAREGHDFGYGDCQALIETTAREPEASPIGVYMVMNHSPSAIVLRADSGIRTPADLPGLTITGHAVDVGMNTFEQYADRAGFDPRSVKTVSNGGDWAALLGLLGEGKVDGLFGYLSTVSAAVRSSGKKVDSEVRFLRFKDVAPDLYGSVLMASSAFARHQPEIVSAFVRAINRGVLAAADDPDAAIEALVNHDPERQRSVDRLRLLETFEEDVGGEEAFAMGVGDIDAARMERLLKLTAETRQLPRLPTMDEVFTSAFLPALDERKFVSGSEPKTTRH